MQHVRNTYIHTYLLTYIPKEKAKQVSSHDTRYTEESYVFIKMFNEICSEIFQHEKFASQHMYICCIFIC